MSILLWGLLRIVFMVLFLVIICSRKCNVGFIVLLMISNGDDKLMLFNFCSSFLSLMVNKYVF